MRGIFGMEKEIFKQIDGFNGRYNISSKGYVVNSLGLVLTAKLDKHGYPKIRINFKRKCHHFYIHRLLAIYFIPNPENKPQVNHKNRIRDDNRLENLEWVTNQENIIHSFRNGRKSTHSRGELNPASILKDIDIPVIRSLLSSEQYHIQEIADLYKVSASTIYGIRSGKKWIHVK